MSLATKAPLACCDSCTVVAAYELRRHDDVGSFDVEHWSHAASLHHTPKLSGLHGHLQEFTGHGKLTRSWAYPSTCACLCLGKAQAHGCAAHNGCRGCAPVAAQQVFLLKVLQWTPVRTPDLTL